MKTRSHINRSLRWGLLAGALAAAAGCRAPSEPQGRAAARFETCVPCHGQQGQGIPDLEAPPIAGLPAWYVEAQLQKFRTGQRGLHPEDLAGMRMQPVSRTLPTDEDVRAMATHVAGLPRPPLQPLALNGNISRGQALYATCIACHGMDGAGMEALKAPPIAGHPDWYLYSQLRKFKVGARGAHPQDASGALMRSMTLTLDDQGMKDVAAHAWSMARK